MGFLVAVLICFEASHMFLSDFKHAEKKFWFVKLQEQCFENDCDTIRQHR